MKFEYAGISGKTQLGPLAQVIFLMIVKQVTMTIDLT